MSDERETPAKGDRGGGRELSLVLPSGRRFWAVVETALRIYLRPICLGGEPPPALHSELAAMIDEVAGEEPLEVSFSCRRPALEITVRAGGRERSRRFTIAPEGPPEAP